MRRLFFGATLVLGLAAVAPAGRAQFANPGDPFGQYYGYFIPRQQSIAAQLRGGNVASINVNAADRRAAVLAQRAQSAGPAFAPFGLSELVDPEASFAGRRPLRPPTIVFPGQPSRALPHPNYFSRTATYFYNPPTGAPGTVGRIR